ncbi:MAG: D-alanine--D-alanine ligase [Candidatus Scalindua sp.]|jgi:D-alanine-D-alanine ligase|nr:D-alanine--D-alanine ligase [Candidatus Scalindua sp.]MBT5307558.1 D-alanine--D-alanine ligase [Candidatus Scalindua sp.]MBT6049232.1 D-alanine--D-alanine ligase [Candidatus Scalindua sp.]MBT6225527.1 D-alanine--D-alanine ligase [Candidatus Scalindua sp.]MBT6565214.1 D-alanine--D-alanine ligase [Candidatus Scalindua sp.]
MSDEKYIVVLMGGISSEREISLQSGKAVANALSKDNNNVIKIIVNDDMVNELDNYKIDIAFIALHGHFGEDGGIQEVLESKNIPYTGSGISASRLAMDKVESKDVFRRNNIPTPNYLAVSAEQSISEITKGIKNLKLPVITKPASNGSSIGISIIREYIGIKDALEYTGSYSKEILVEEYIEGRELTVSVLSGKALPVIEIKAATGFYDYDAKYKSDTTQYIVLTSADESSGTTLSHTVYNRVQELAVRAHNSLGCSTFSRVDMILDKDDEVYILEVNTIPGFTERSLLPKAAAAANISFTELCNSIVNAASQHTFSSEQVTQAYIHDKNIARI